MTVFHDDPIDETSSMELIHAFKEACAQYNLLPDGQEARDIATLIRHAFRNGAVTTDALLMLVRKLAL